jgi:hypothetical protein
LLLIACTRSRAPRVATGDAGTGVRTVAIRAATVVDVMNGSLRAKQTVLVVGNRITAVGPADQVRIPDDADLVDGTGRFVIPGLWDMHVHSVANVAVDRSLESVAARDWWVKTLKQPLLNSKRPETSTASSRAHRHRPRVLQWRGPVGHVHALRTRFGADAHGTAHSRPNAGDSVTDR